MKFMHSAPFRRLTDRPVGDTIPFFDHASGRYHLFHLTVSEHGTDADRLNRVTWEHASSSDLVAWTEHATALRPGGDDAVDRDGAYTGCLIEREGVYHLFYTGVSLSSATPQTICHATSLDLEQFTKDPANPLVLPDPSAFEPADWRDPFVFWNDDAGEYWMLISARSLTGPSTRRGVVALARSSDLQTWEVDPEPLLAPWRMRIPECCEIHRLEADRYLLSYSSYTEQPGLSHFLASSPEGPWTEAEGFTDGSRWYAGKSTLDADGRLVSFAWIPERAGGLNETEFVWGGDFGMPRETWVDERGRVCQRIAPGVAAAYSKSGSVGLEIEAGSWELSDEGARCTAPALGLVVVDAGLGDEAVLFTGAITWGGDYRGAAGLILHADPDLSVGIRLVIDPAAGRVRLEEVTAEFTHTVVTTRGPWVEHHYEPVVPSRVEFQLVLEGSLIEVFIDDRLALSHRFYSTTPGLRLFAEGPDVDFSGLAARRMS